jgi:hypothetical protein
MTVVILLRDLLYSILRSPDSIKQVLHCLVSTVAKVNKNITNQKIIVLDCAAVEDIEFPEDSVPSGACSFVS